MFIFDNPLWIKMLEEMFKTDHKDKESLLRLVVIYLYDNSETLDFLGKQ